MTEAPEGSQDKRARLARLLAQRASVDAGRTASRPAAASIVRQPRGAALPLSFAQQRIWFFDQLTPGSPVYNIHFGVRLTGRLDVERLRGCVSAIVGRHDALRSRFQAAGDGAAVQIADGAATVDLPLIDLRHLDADARVTEERRLTAAEAARPFDLATGPLFRATVLRIADDEHVLLMTLHHIVGDGTSTSIVMRELKALYEGAILPDLPIQYTDFACRQREQLAAGAPLDAQLAFWRGQLAGDLPVLDLPTDGSRLATPTYRGGTHVTTLPTTLFDGLRAVSRAEGATVFMTMLAAFQLLIGRLSGQDDVIVGTPVSGRCSVDAEPLIGCFINTLPIRTSLAGAPTFVELLRRVRDTALAAYANQDVPFERLVEELNPPRDAGRSPVFQVLFNMLGTDAALRTTLGDVVAEPLPPPDEPSKFDLTMYVGETAGALYLRTVYNADLFSAARIAECVTQYEQLLGEIVRDPRRPVLDYSLVTPQAAAVLPNAAAPLLSRWDGSVVEALARHAAATPERTAVTFGAVAYSYRDIDEWSSAAAGRLAALGVGEGAVVGVEARRAPGLVAALLGVWKTGAAFVILDPQYPRARLDACRDAAGIHALVTVGESVDAADHTHPPVPTFDVESVRDHAATRTGVAALDPDGTAYIAFTSGSTGAPKGIVGTHRPLSHFLAWQATTFRLDASDRISLLSGLAHDPALRDMFAPLWVGASLHIPEQAVFESPHALVEWMRAERITVAHLTPSLSQALAQGWSDNADPLSLRTVAFGGELLRHDDVARIRAMAPDVCVVNFYGTTETPQAMAWFAVPEDDDSSASSAIVPVGRGIDDVQVLVVNDAGRLAGIGEVGEVVVRTPYLTRGYLAGTVDDARRFAANPFTGDAGDRVYRTGDVGRYLADGNVVVVGRRDRQVKVRGFRVELAGVEAALRDGVGVRQIVVAAPADRTGTTVLVAYVVGDDRLRIDRLRDLATQRLPHYMVPAVFVPLAHIPLTPNGKIDFGKLPDPFAATAIVERVAPSTATERTVAGVWSEVLRVAAPGVHDNFFQLGGHSLLAMQVMSRLRAALGVELPLRALFESPTVHLLARYADTIVWAVGEESAAAPAAGAVEFDL